MNINEYFDNIFELSHLHALVNAIGEDELVGGVGEGVEGLCEEAVGARVHPRPQLHQEVHPIAVEGTGPLSRQLNLLPMAAIRR